MNLSLDESDLETEEQIDEFEGVEESINIEVKPVTASISRVTPYSTLTISFSDQMMFPEDLKEQLNGIDQVLMTLNFESQEELPTQLESWTVTEVSRSSIEIALVFSDPFQVSMGEFMDQIYVNLFFADFVSITGASLPTKHSMDATVPFQVSSDLEQQALGLIGDAAFVATLVGAVAAITTIVPLKMIWDSITAQQITVHVPFFKHLLMPAQA